MSDVDGILKNLARVDKKRGTISQVFDASCVAGPEHLVHAARLALISWMTERSFANSLNIELICWVAAERQIARAFEKVGLRVGNKTLAILILGNSRAQVKEATAAIFNELSLKRDDRVLEFTHKKALKLRKIFSISKNESKVAPIQKLVLERIALLALEK